MFVLTSPGFDDAQTMPSKYAKSPAVGGENVSPPLSWDGSPRQVKSFALAVVDRHPVARNYVHWLVADISADVMSLEEGASGQGAMPVGSRELKAYAGPNPPSGSHAYEFTIYALATQSLDLAAKVNLDTFTAAAQASAIATATLVERSPERRSPIS